MSEHDHDHERERDDDRTNGSHDENSEYDENGDRAVEGGYEPDASGTGPTYCAYTDYTQEGATVESLPATGEGSVGLERRVWDRLYEIDDPEMPVSIVDLGLIYGVRIVEPAENSSSGDSGGSDEGGHNDDGGDNGDATGARITIDMTLTYTGCPARKMLTDEVRAAVADLDGVGRVDLDLVWSPNWSLAMVTAQGRADLREFGLSVPDPGEVA